MKKTIIRLILALFLIAAVLSHSQNAHAKEKPFRCQLTMRLTSIKVSWKQPKGAVKYKIYRADVTKKKIYDAEYPEEKDYKKIKTVKNAGSYVDKKVRQNRYYTYMVKAFDKKGRLVKSTYEPDYLEFGCAGLGQPEIRNDGYGENNTNGPKKIYLSMNQDDAAASVTNVKYIIYRKKEGSKKYKKLAEVKSNNFYVDYKDKTVKPGSTYYYKVKVVKNDGRKTWSSKKSQPVIIPTSNFTAKYKVNFLTPAGVFTDRSVLDVKLRLKNASKYNGKTMLLRSEASYSAGQKGASVDNGHMYKIRLTDYSTDNKNWTPIPAKGVKLPKSGWLYLKGQIINDGSEEAIWFGGSDPGWAFSNIGQEEIEGLLHYYGPGLGYTSFGLNCITGKGGAYLEWD